MGYGLIGEKLGHSFSPAIHALLGDYPYALFPLEREDLPRFMAENTLEGFNVTIPYKEAVLPFLAQVTARARRIGSVNTVIRLKNGDLKGDNTDYAGFKRLLGDGGLFKGKKAIVLGSGGASKTVRTVLEDEGIGPVITVSRRGDVCYGSLDKHLDAALVVNATPVGMYPLVEAAPLSLSGFQSCKMVLDLVYNPFRTELMLEAERQHIPCRGGLSMLAAQAQEAARLWKACGEKDRVDEIMECILKKTLNVALIGMPGCGKTRIARLLGKMTGKRVFDIDDMVAKESGMAAGDIIAQMGEETFRGMETHSLKAAATESGCIISTGGGIVTRPHNLDILRRNSRIVWLRRDLRLLPLGGRPLSQGRGVEEIYRDRKKLYERWSDFVYDNHDAQATARKIMEDLL